MSDRPFFLPDWHNQKETGTFWLRLNAVTRYIDCVESNSPETPAMTTSSSYSLEALTAFEYAFAAAMKVSGAVFAIRFSDLGDATYRAIASAPAMPGYQLQRAVNVAAGLIADNARLDQRTRSMMVSIEESLNGQIEVLLVL